METAAAAAARIISSSPVLRFSGDGDGVRSLKLPFRRQVCLRSGFSDSGHVQYYQSPIIRSEKKQKEKVKVIETDNKKMKMKFIKRLTKDLNFCSQSQELGSPLMAEVKGKMMSEATETLLAQLENLRTEQKEQKRKRKEEKAKLKAMMKAESSSSSSSSSSCSSESSDCDGGGKAIDMRSRREKAMPQLTENEAEQGRLRETSAEAQTEMVSTTTTTTSFNIEQLSSINTESVSNTKIEICMGGKCKKLGAPMLMEEFERKLGTEGSVVGCKCMGKCKSAPNVKVSNSTSEIQEESVKCSIQTPTNPLYIGVGLEDVEAIVADLFSKNWSDNSVLAAA